MRLLLKPELGCSGIALAINKKGGRNDEMKTIGHRRDAQKCADSVCAPSSLENLEKTKSTTA